jgi:thioredoxin 1
MNRGSLLIALLGLMLLIVGCNQPTPPVAPVPPAETSGQTPSADATGQAPSADATGESQPAQDAHPVELTDADFEQKVLQSKGVVLVDLWAPWCPPCVALAPTIEELATDYAGRVTVAKLNIDDNSETPDKFEVSSIPTLLFFKDGALVERVVGREEKATLAAKLDGLLTAP